MSQTLTGEWGRPVNTAAHQKGGIHDDDTATELGFRGGTVAGSIHLEQFLPLLLAAFGDDWWHQGVLSMYFRHATMDRQPVRCHLTPGDDGQAQVWMETEAGETVMDGTANLAGCRTATALATRLAAQKPAADLRILKAFQVGQNVSVPTRVSREFVDRQLEVITQTHEYFTDAAILGQRALPYTQVVRAFDAAEQALAEPAIQPFVGLYGAIEIGFVNGPVLEETDYDATSEVVGLGDSPKTEILWRESRLSRDGAPVARMLKMDRLMKGSSPLWD